MLNLQNIIFGRKSFWAQTMQCTLSDCIVFIKFFFCFFSLFFTLLLLKYTHSLHIYLGYTIQLPIRNRKKQNFFISIMDCARSPIKYIFKFFICQYYVVFFNQIQKFSAPQQFGIGSDMRKKHAQRIISLITSSLFASLIV